MGPFSKPMKRSGPLMGENEMNVETNEETKTIGQRTSAPRVDGLVAILESHRSVMAHLESVHDAQLAPYCSLLSERIRQHVVPVLEEAIVAARILDQMSERLPPLTLESLEHRIMLGYQYAPYRGGETLES